MVLSTGNGKPQKLGLTAFSWCIFFWIFIYGWGTGFDRQGDGIKTKLRPIVGKPGYHYKNNWENLYIYVLNSWSVTPAIFKFHHTSFLISEWDQNQFKRANKVNVMNAMEDSKTNGFNNKRKQFVHFAQS